MGRQAIRITAADFVTPPELAAWRLASEGAGRIGGVRLELTATAGLTRLGACYQQVPLRVLPPFSFGPGKPSLLYLLNPTAGLLDGDAHLIEVTAQPGSRALVTGQSATRLHPCLHGYGTQQWRIRVESGALLVVLPGPAIPFRGCRYYQRVAIDLAAGASVIYGDVWLAGRYARGAESEQFQFATIVQELIVRREEGLVFRDRFCWQGPWRADERSWHFGPDLACGSLFVAGDAAAHLQPDALACPHARFLTAAGDTCVRCHGPAATVIADVVHLAGQAQGSRLFGDGHLSPNHWFSVAD